ncbi:MAG: hypothetical protein R3D85_04270 [Paracoccaceae bacterium]|jgi:hypothetical protein
MTRIAALTLATALAASPVWAEDEKQGTTLMQEGAKLLFKGLMQEMEPAMDDLRKFSQEVGPKFELMIGEMGPALADLLSKIDDITAYHAPEILPNGDIILRRKTPLERERDKPDTGGEIEL